MNAKRTNPSVCWKNSKWNNEIFLSTLSIFMRIELNNSSLSAFLTRLVGNSRGAFIKGNELKLTQIKSLSFFIFKNVRFNNAWCIYNTIANCYDLQDSCSWESIKSHFNNGKFSNRSIWDEKSPSAEVIYNDGVHTHCSTADSKGNNTQKYYLTQQFK